MAQIGTTTPRPSTRLSTARMRRHAGLLIPSLLAISLACRDTTEPAQTPDGAGAPSLAAAAAAGHRTVTSLADPGDGTCNATQCTLREAVADPGSTDIGFAAGLTGAVTLAAPKAGGGTLVIRKSLTIAGPGAGITVRRRATDPQFRILTIEPGATVTLANLTLRNGRTDRVGGGIVNFGTLTLRNCTVAGNASSQHGGGIDNHGPLTLEHTTVANNSASGSGGGIDNHGMTLTVTNSSIVRNTGSGIESGGGTLAITSTAVSYNSRRGITLDWGSRYAGEGQNPGQLGRRHRTPPGHGRAHEQHGLAEFGRRRRRHHQLGRRQVHDREQHDFEQRRQRPGRGHLQHGGRSLRPAVRQCQADQQHRLGELRRLRRRDRELGPPGWSVRHRHQQHDRLQFGAGDGRRDRRGRGGPGKLEHRFAGEQPRGPGTPRRPAPT